MRAALRMSYRVDLPMAFVSSSSDFVRSRISVTG
ncbi:Uncharacterised protein [Mycobacteroides abscessus]|nr:Uncharacterised protein [Mycobacteroides abscessus]